jgi:outer membrane protein assembly factor BamB
VSLRISIPTLLRFAVAVAALGAAAPAVDAGQAAPDADRGQAAPGIGRWLQWGGPRGDFTVPVTGLADAWPEEGPPELWRRELGEGDSAIVVDGERLFTMYRRDDREVVAALSVTDGSTLWEYDYEVNVRGYALDFGSGPHASPLVLGDRLFTVGFVGDLYAFDKRTGDVLWSVNLWRDLRGTRRDRGYSSSPIAYHDTVILPVGGRGQALVGFDPADGSVRWSGGDFDNAHATPLLINLDGQDQVVAFMVDYVAGLDPSSGQLLWRHPHETDYGLNISTPIWGGDNLLFVSSAYSGGSRALRLTLEGDATRVDEAWYTNRLRLHFGNAIRIGDVMYGANGDFGPSFVTALDMRDGDVLWRDRSFAKASFLYADGKLIVLDEDGVLGLATIAPTGLQVLSRADIFRSRSWTVPTLVGTRLYARDLREIAAFELGEQITDGH